ncbi:hypothetical protein D3C78_1045590 [compost metagenome]
MHRAAADDDQAIQGDLFVGHHLPALLLPVRLQVILLHQMPGQRLQPVRFDLRDHACEQLGGLDQFGGHDPLRLLAADHAGGVNPETPLARTKVIALLRLLADLAEQAGEDRLVHGGIVDIANRLLSDLLFVGASLLAIGCPTRHLARRGTRFASKGWGAPLVPTFRALREQLQLAADQRQLPVRIPPFTQAQIVEEILPAPATQRIGTQRLALFLEAAPEVDQRGEVRIRVLPLRMRLVGGLLALDRTLTRVLHRKRAGHGEHFIETALMRRFQQHAAEARINGQARQLAAQRGELALAVHRRELLQQGEAVLDRLAVRRLDEGERLDIAEAQVEHLQDYRRQVGPEDFRISEGGSR